MSEGHGGRAKPTLLSGIRGRCPRCGEGRLFSGFLDLGMACDRCGLDYGFADAGDGPAVFVMLFVGFLVVGGALAVEMLYRPPLWLHAVLWLPLATGLAIGVLRPLKGVMVSLQYTHSAGAARRLDD